MLVDDDEATNFLNSHIINKQNIAKELVIVKNGQTALDTLKAYQQSDVQQPELIFLDINMPVMNGFEFLQALEELYPDYRDDTQIVMLTTSLNPEDIRRVKALGVTDFVNKPLSKTKLAAILQKYFTDDKTFY